MISQRAILKTKGDFENFEQNFLPFSKRAKTKKNIPGRYRSIYLVGGFNPSEKYYSLLLFIDELQGKRVTLQPHFLHAHPVFGARRQATSPPVIS